MLGMQKRMRRCHVCCISTWCLVAELLKLTDEMSLVGIAVFVGKLGEIGMWVLL
jgi:hypothetical protein